MKTAFAPVLFIAPMLTHSSQHNDGGIRTCCICGAIIGRCQECPSSDSQGPMVYRLAKYAVRPLSPNSEYVICLPYLMLPQLLLDGNASHSSSGSLGLKYRSSSSLQSIEVFSKRSV